MNEMMKRKHSNAVHLLVLFFALFFCLVVMLINLPKAHAASGWTGYGSGTEDDPYLIYTKAELLKFRDIVEGANGEEQNESACATLKRNINLNGSETDQWDPIGNDLWDAFDGTFDGRNHSISGLYIHIDAPSELPGDDKNHFGLFGSLGAQATIKNVIVNGAITIENITDDDDWCAVGGINGTVYGAYSTFENCLSNVTINATGCNVTAGGIVGAFSFYGSTIKNCINTGTITTGYKAGGIVGTISGMDRDEEDISKISYCYNTGNITVPTDTGCAGGIAGEMNYSYIDNCYNSGNMTGYNAGGIVGIQDYRTNEIKLENHIKNCYNDGNLSGLYIGGVASVAYGVIEKCHSFATTIDGIGVDGNRGVLLSHLAKDTSSGYYYSVGKCYYSYGLAVDGASRLIGKIDDDTINEDSYRKDITTFHDEEYFHNWDFVDNWEIKQNAQYPTLRNMPVIEEAPDEPYPHTTHNFTYAASGATITATCNSGSDYEACPITEGLSLTLVAPANKEYDGTVSMATIQGGYSDVAFPNATIKYYKGTTEVTECKDAGTYTAKVTFGSATVQVTFSITSPDTPVDPVNPDDPSGTTDHKKIEDKETGVSVETSSKIDIPTNITLKVVLNTKVVEKDYESIKNILDNQRIRRVYDIKLIQTVDGVEKEIQPSDIQPGTNIIIHITVPKGINADKAKIVHVHNGEAKFIANVEVINGEFVFEVAELSDFAIVTPKTGFITDSHGFCAGWVVFIFAITLLIYLALYILIHFGLANGLIKALKLDGLKNVLKLLGIINVAASGAICVFALVTLILHACPISLVSFIIVALATITFTTLFILTLKKGKTNEVKEEAKEE